jgi:hypothetical protein
LPDTLTTITNKAFSDCTGLERLQLPTSVTYINNDAFEYCSNLIVTTTRKASNWPELWSTYWARHIKTVVFEYSAEKSGLIPPIETTFGNIVYSGYPAFYAGGRTTVPSWLDSADFMVLDNGVFKAAAG